jgi:hypothetical protein
MIMTVKLKEGETVLQIPNFNAELKMNVRAKLLKEKPQKSLKQFVTMVFEAYEKGELKFK